MTLNQQELVDKTVSVLWLRGLLQAAEQLGMDSTALLAQADIPSDLLSTPYARLSLEQNLRLWRVMEQRSPHVNLGLKIGAMVKPSHFQLLALTLMHSPNLGEALTKSMRYTRLLSDGGKYRLQVEAAGAALCYEPQASGFSSHQVDAVMVLLHHFSSWLACRTLPLLKVELRHNAPLHSHEHEQVFAAPVVFGAPQNALWFDLSVLQEPLSLTDNYLAQLHEQLLEEQLMQIQQQDIVAVVRHALKCSDDLTISRDVLAAQLNLSGRSLQRRLQECSTSFQTLFDEERYLRAQQLLKQGSQTLTDISAQLGFAESSVFSRAFKRWSGISPLDYRQQFSKTPT